MSKQTCAVSTCKNNAKKTRDNSDIVYHRFPKNDQELIEKWKIACQCPSVNSQGAAICSVHFTPDDYVRDLKNELLGLKTRKVLKKGAEPTLFVPGLPELTECQKRRQETYKQREEVKARKELISEILRANEENERRIAAENLLAEDELIEVKVEPDEIQIIDESELADTNNGPCQPEVVFSLCFLCRKYYIFTESLKLEGPKLSKLKLLKRFLKEIIKETDKQLEKKNVLAKQFRIGNNQLSLCPQCTFNLDNVYQRQVHVEQLRMELESLESEVIRLKDELINHMFETCKISRPLIGGKDDGQGAGSEFPASAGGTENMEQEDIFDSVATNSPNILPQAEELKSKFRKLTSMMKFTSAKRDKTVQRSRSKVVANRTKAPRKKPEPPFQCEICGQIFRKAYNLALHLRTHSGEKPYSCSHCDKCFHRKETLTTHELRHTKEKKHCCQFCGRMFSMGIALRDHMANLHNYIENPFLCELCPEEKFLRPTFLAKHKALVHGEGEVSSLLQSVTSRFRNSRAGPAGAGAAGTQDLSNKLGKEESTCCFECGREFEHLTDLKSHYNKTGHLRSANSVQCEICSSTFAGRQSLLNHIKVVHNNIKRVTCPVENCGKQMVNKSMLKRHLHSHQGVVRKSLKCNYCDERFSQHRAKRRHEVQTHSEQHLITKKFVCSCCWMLFELETNLQDHETESHARCTFQDCNKLFLGKDKLLFHERVHTGERPFPCKHCPKTFSRRDNLSTHENVHIKKNRPFNCTECKRGFVRKSSLRAHIEKVHSSSSVPGDESLEDP